MNAESSGSAAVPLATVQWTDLSQLSALHLAQLAAASLSILALRIPRAAWAVGNVAAVPLRAMLRAQQYRAQIEAMSLLDDHLRRDAGLPRQRRTPPPMNFFDTF